MQKFDLTKVYGFKQVVVPKGVAINLRDENVSGQVGAKIGSRTPGGGGGEQS